MNKPSLKSGYNRLIVIFGLIWFVFSILFAFFDLEISKTVVDLGSGSGRFVEHFGGIPGLVLVEFAFFILAGNIMSEINSIRYLQLGIVATITMVIPYFSFKTLFLSIKGLKKFFLSEKYFILLFFGIISVLMIFIFRTVLKKFSEKYRYFSYITVQLFLYCYVFLTHILKYFSGRVRFRDLAEGFSNFTPWYLFNGPNGNSSFPSGHTVLAWLLLPLIFAFINGNKTVRVGVMSALVAWGGYVSVFRVIVGAHYASDVLFSTGFTIIFLLFLIKKYNVGEC
jgi:membrane-associated phospholipid phosphatase